ncbi:MAG: hypothetical protein IIU06_01915, partial [Erysipelotrichales bacterium]|nr:hypothetical protein [Erysipelotrichales bacterium]
MRTTINLKDGWYFVKDVPSLEEALANTEKEPVILPHTWNAKDGQDGGNDYFRGTCAYITHLPKPELGDKDELWAEFEGAAMSASVYLNSERIYDHEGGYSAFRVNLTPYLKDVNTMTVLVNNAKNHVYPQSADFTFYGGLYREVHLLIVPKIHFSLGYKGGKGLKVTPELEVDENGVPTGKGTVHAEAWLENGDAEVTFTTNGESKTVMSEEGYACADFPMENMHLWNGVKDPYLYEMKAETDGDSVETKYGCRVYEIDAKRGFVLNGKEYPLRGVSRHQDRLGAGNALTREMHEEDMAMIREIGANSVRLAHYQHAQYFYDLCDRYGIIAWAEIPYITMHMKEGCANTLSQMEELIIQNYNHPSIVVWGLSNEITAASPVNEDLLENHRALNDLAHRLDPTRLTTMANVFMLETDSPILEIPDVNAYNLYFGWYLGELEQNDEFFDEWHEKYPERPIGFSEYGADTNPAFHNSHPERGDYSEIYQCVYHEHILRMIEERPWLWCTYVWNMFDFAADGRDEGGKHGQNQKGLVTMDRKLRKDAFWLYKAYWSDEPFVYITGRRYVNRNERETTVKVYSNLPFVTLYANGEKVETKYAHHVFEFRIPLEGEVKLTAEAGSVSDEIAVRYTDTPDLSYVLNK